MSRRHSGHKRSAADFYAEPREVVEALFDRERFTGTILDPGCGSGAIVRAAVERGYRAAGTDLHDRGFGRAPHDWLADDYPWRAANVVCNPPYREARAFLERALERTTGKVALLLPLGWKAAGTRRAWLNSTPWARSWVLCWRICFRPNGESIKGRNNPSENHAWYVFDHNHKGPPVELLVGRKKKESRDV